MNGNWIEFGVSTKVSGFYSNQIQRNYYLICIQVKPNLEQAQMV